MKKIMIVKPGTISAKDKEKMSKNGMLVIEHPFPNEVRVVDESDEVSGGDILMSAMIATNSSFNSREQFTIELVKRMKKAEDKRNGIVRDKAQVDAS